MKAELFTEPFDPGDVKKRPDGYDYIEYGDVARRMIEASENAYSWEVVKIDMMSTEQGKIYWMCHGRLTVPGLGARDGIGIQDAIGPQAAEAPKGAESDAFKRAASKFGVALELYDKDRPKSGRAQQFSQASNAANGNGASSRPAEVAEQSAGLWGGPGQCPQCHAPEGKRHGKPCL